MKIDEFLIERYYGKYEFSTRYMLSSSDSESWSVQEILDLDGNFKDNLDNFLMLHLGYTESAGNPQLREVIAELYNSIEMENILVFSGAEEGIFGYMMSILQPQDHLIVMFPTYQSLYEVAQANGVEVSYWHMNEEQGWKVDIEELKKLIIEGQTRAILINSPHNPTGFQFSHEELELIIDICKEYNIYLFSDEVYRLGEYEEEDRLPASCDLYEYAVSLGVLSKPMGLPGLRIGWIATQNREFIEKLQQFKDYTTICNSAPSEFLATLALINVNRIITRNRNITLDNLELLREFMNRYRNVFQWTEPSAGSIAFIRLLIDIDVEEFCADLRKKKEVLLLPSTTYKFGVKHFRIGFGRKKFDQALQLLEDYVQEDILPKI